MKNLSIFLLVIGLSNFASAQQSLLHINAIRLQLQNTAWKMAHNKLYTDAIEDVKGIKEDILKAKGQMEEIQRLTYKGLTDIHTSIKEAKKFYFMIKSIARTNEALKEAYSLALGIKMKKSTSGGGTGTGVITGDINNPSGYELEIWHNPILPLHIKFNKIIVEKCIALVTFTNDFIREQKAVIDLGGAGTATGTGTSTSTSGESGTGTGVGTQTGTGAVDGGQTGNFTTKTKNIISNVVREQLLSQMYQRAYTIEIITKSYLNAVKTVRWQADAQNILPWKHMIWEDQLIIERMKQKINF